MQISDSPKRSPRVAVIAHVFYLDIWPELAACILNVKEVSSSADIFVTLPESTDESAVHRIKSTFPEADVRRLSNRGFDVGPFFEVISRIDLDSYDYVVKLHTKRNGFGIVNFCPLPGRSWRKLLLGFCSSPENAKQTFALLNDNPKVGMVGSGALVMHPEDELTGRFSISGAESEQPEKSADWCFIAGTMFAVRAALLKKMACRLSFDDFPAMPAGSHDAGLAHSIEREFGREVHKQGFQIAPCPKSPRLLSSTFRIRRATYAFCCLILRHLLRRAQPRHK